MSVVAVFPADVVATQRRGEASFELPQTLGERGLCVQGEQHVQMIRHHDPSADGPKTTGGQSVAIACEQREERRLVQTRGGASEV